MPGTETYASGTTPYTRDPRRKLQVKEILATQAISLSGGVGAVYSGSGSPTGVVTPTASAALYYDTDNGDIYEWDGAAWV